MGTYVWYFCVEKKYYTCYGQTLRDIDLAERAQKHMLSESYMMYPTWDTFLKECDE
jgi:hypothetical protein